MKQTAGFALKFLKHRGPLFGMRGWKLVTHHWQVAARTPDLCSPPECVIAEELGKAR